MVSTSPTSVGAPTLVHASISSPLIYATGPGVACLLPVITVIFATESKPPSLLGTLPQTLPHSEENPNVPTPRGHLSPQPQ